MGQNLYTICAYPKGKKLYENSGLPKRKLPRKLKIGTDLFLGFMSNPSKFGFHSMILYPSKLAKYISLQLKNKQTKTTTTKKIVHGMLRTITKELGSHIGLMFAKIYPNKI